VPSWLLVCTLHVVYSARQVGEAPRGSFVPPVPGEECRHCDCPVPTIFGLPTGGQKTTEGLCPHRVTSPCRTPPSFPSSCQTPESPGRRSHKPQMDGSGWELILEGHHGMELFWTTQVHGGRVPRYVDNGWCRLSTSTNHRSPRSDIPHAASRSRGGSNMRMDHREMPNAARCWIL
jgi:hypothetical protein